jgi:hypothetical protein
MSFFPSISTLSSHSLAAAFRASKRLAVFGLLGAALFSGCKDVTNPEDTNETEVFTTVQLALTNQDDASDKPEATIKFKDGFGHGDAMEKNETLMLKAGATYSAELILLNESANPAEIMSEEVEEEGVDHQIFYAPSGVALTVTYADKDANNRPIGLLTEFKADAAGTGTLKVTLKHQPDLKSDNSTVTTGDTDVEVSFNVTVQ